MTSEERYQFARITAKNAEVVHAEKRRIEEVKKRAVQNGLLKGLSVELVAEINDVPIEFVLDIQQQLNEK